MKKLFTTKSGTKRSYHYTCSDFLLDGEHRLYVEDYFHEMVSLERKRSERSKKPFVLMLMNIENIAHEPSISALINRIVCSLAAATREIDIKGWYKNCHTIGVIFLEAGAKDIEALDKKIGSEMAAEKALGPALSQKIRLSFHVFPEEHGEKRLKMPFDSVLYPDTAKKAAARKNLFFLKRALDIGGSIFGLMLFSPFFLSIAVVIKLSSRGPVFFKQSRLGHFGMPFVFLKFRSMYADNDENIHSEYVKRLILEEQAYENGDGPGSGKVYKIKNDPRVTPFGRILRKTSLDELPQFLNVLKGEMSLVGPRPPIPYEVENYETWHWRRIQAKPGITGFWQVKGRSKTTFNEMVRMDVRYIDRWSLWSDIKILLQTPFSIISSKGAY